MKRAALATLLAAACDPAGTSTGDRDAALPTCATPAYPVQQIRLLTRREYDASVRDLLPSLVATCATDADCDLRHQSCVADTCVADACALVTFVLPAPDGPYGSVHVAGSFNGWPATRAEGGWPMTWVASERAYVAKHAVPDGRHLYKLVIDDGVDWVADPSNAATEPDGFGENNSVLIQQCDGAAPVTGDGFDPAADFPVESRPQGYAFDNHADAGLVTSVHVGQYLDAAATIADQALARPAELLGCTPTDDACVRGWVTAFGRRAFRRPLTPAEVDRYAGYVTAQADRTTGLSVALQVMLSSPDFLYRSEVGEDVGDGTAVLTAWETATALAYLLWGTTPDDALLDAAANGDLDTPAGIEIQARRLLDDPRARGLVGTFTEQWLGIEKVSTLDRSEALFPGFTPAVRAGMRDETRTFVEHVTFDAGRTFADLFTSDVTWIGDAVAPFYDLPPPGSVAAVQVAGDPRRAGLLGQGSVLAATAHSDQTSPIRRGVFVRERLLCQDLGLPPANAGGVPDVDPTATTRERFAQHTADPFCSGCHQYIDGVGFGFEHFDPVGRWRDDDAGQPIDAAGDLNDLEGIGTRTHAPFDGLPQLGELLATSPSARRCFADQWLRFTLGRENDPADCSLDAVDDPFAQSGGSIPELLVALTQAPSFTRRTTP
ncbi:MAG: DUF1592 domain-containing protein [Alphaproteobacteria bacterium]|nr:DUF1592 domain-containing protein [Alphaproteobacteria bacterium]